MERRIALVTGGSSGIGFQTARALADKGYRVYEFSRRDIHQEQVIHKTVDVTKEAQVRDGVEEILMEEGKIDLLVNCAGFGISGAVEYTEESQARAQFDVNFFGIVNVTKAVIPTMRQAGRGKIINISSVAASAHIPFQAFYSASKAAVSSYSCALDNELSPYGIRVTAVQLGDIHTGFTGARQKSIEGDEVYGGRIARSVAQMERDELHGADPRVVGAAIARIADMKNPGPIRTVGAWYGFLNLLCRLLPPRMRGFLVGKVYGG